MPALGHQAKVPAMEVGMIPLLALLGRARGISGVWPKVTGGLLSHAAASSGKDTDTVMRVGLKKAGTTATALLVVLFTSRVLIRLQTTPE